MVKKKSFVEYRKGEIKYKQYKKKNKSYHKKVKAWYNKANKGSLYSYIKRLTKFSYNYTKAKNYYIRRLKAHFRRLRRIRLGHSVFIRPIGHHFRQYLVTRKRDWAKVNSVRDKINSYKITKLCKRSFYLVKLIHPRVFHKIGKQKIRWSTVYNIYRELEKNAISRYCQSRSREGRHKLNTNKEIQKLLQLRINAMVDNEHDFSQNYSNLSWLYWAYNNIPQIISPTLLRLSFKPKSEITIDRGDWAQQISMSLSRQLLTVNILKRKFNIIKWQLRPRIRVHSNSGTKILRKYYSKNSKYANTYDLNYGRFFFFKQRKFNILSYFFFDKFKNRYMFKGQKSLITNIFNNVFIKFKLGLQINFQNIIKTLLFLTRPIFSFVRRRKAKQIFLVPVPIHWHKQYKMATKWIFLTINEGSGRSLEHKLIKEVSRVLLRKKNALIRRRNLFYNNVVENRFYTNFRWK